MAKISLIRITNIFLLFCLVFGFKLPILNSTYLAGFIAFLIIIITPGRFKVLLNFISKKYVLSLILLTFLIVVVNILIAFFHGSYDFSIAKQMIGNLPVLVCSIFVFVVIFPTMTREKDIIKIIIDIFVIQSMVIISAFLFPSILEIVEMFQYSNSIIGAGNRSNNIFRGFSISGDLFFGLSACYGFVFIFLSKYLLNEKKINFLHVLLLLLIIAANVFIARTGFIGLFFALLLGVFYKSSMSKFKKAKKIVFLISLILLTSWSLAPNRYKEIILNNVLPFAFEFLYSYSNKNQLETSSSNHLLEMYDVQISTKTFLFGDGLFTDSSGHYYRKTDSGYLRQILFGGIFYLGFMIFYQLKIFSYSNVKKRLNKTEKYNLNLFVCFLFIYLLILHIKGLTIGYMRIILIVSWCYFSFINYNKNSSCELTN